MEDRLSRIANRIVADSYDIPGDEETIADHDISIICFYDRELQEQKYFNNFSSICEAEDGTEILCYGTSPFGYKANEVFDITDYDKFSDEFECDLDSDDIAEAIMSAVPLKELSDMFLEDFEGKNDLADWIEERSEEEKSHGNGAYSWLMDLLPEPAVEKVSSVINSMLEFAGTEELLTAVENGKHGVGLKKEWTFYRSYGMWGDCRIVFGKSKYIGTPQDQRKISNMIWEIPITCRVSVDGDDYCVSNDMNDICVYDRSEVMELVRRHLGEKWDDEIEEFLEDNLPDEPDEP